MEFLDLEEAEKSTIQKVRFFFMIHPLIKDFWHKYGEYGVVINCYSGSRLNDIGFFSSFISPKYFTIFATLSSILDSQLC